MSAPGVIAGTKTAIGFRVKSGHAIAVVLRGPLESPSPVAREVVELCDPAAPETRQPYHAGLGQAEQDPKAIARRVKIVERAASALGISDGSASTHWSRDASAPLVARNVAPPSSPAASSIPRASATFTFEPTRTKGGCSAPCSNRPWPPTGSALP